MTESSVDTAKDNTATGAFTSWAIVASLLRAGVVIGLWPVLVGASGVETENLAPFLLHALGSIATVAVVALRRSVVRLIAIAFTGYSTVVLGLSAPGFVGVVIWVTGVIALIALLLAALRRGGPAARWAWISGGALGVLSAVGVTLIGLTG